MKCEKCGAGLGHNAPAEQPERRYTAEEIGKAIMASMDDVALTAEIMHTLYVLPQT